MSRHPRLSDAQVEERHREIAWYESQIRALIVSGGTLRHVWAWSIAADECQKDIDREMRRRRRQRWRR